MRCIILNPVFLLLLGIMFSLPLGSQTGGDSTPATSETQITAEPKSRQEPLLEALRDTAPEPQWRITFGKIFWSVIIFLIALFLIRYLTRILEALSERWARFRLAIKRIIPGVRILIWTAVIYQIIVSVFAPPIETIFAFSASLGIALGFASQDILKNIFGGIMILIDRPFQVGDKIALGSYYGEVVQIGLRTVRIVTGDDNLVSIPNGEVMNQAVANANAGESNCQVVAEFYLPAHIDLREVKKIAYRAAAVSQYVYLNKPIVVVMKNEIHEGRSLLKMRLKAYVLDIRYEFAFASQMTEIVIRALLSKKLLSAEELSMLIPPSVPTVQGRDRVY